MPLPPTLSDAVPLIRTLPRFTDAPLAGLVIVTVGGVVSITVVPDVVPDAIFDGVPITPELLTAATL